MSADDDTAELVPDPHQRTVDRLWDSVDRCRREFTMFRIGFGSPHPDECPTCQARMGAFPKCNDCHGSGGVPGSTLWAIHYVFKVMRKHGLSTYRSKITPERRAG
jgi:hypothetical protein